MRGGAAPIRKLKLFGERNTGTNYLEQLLAVNFEIEQLRGTVPAWFRIRGLRVERSRDLYFALTSRFNLGWKHRLVDDTLSAPADTLLLCLTKNPYAWLRSMFRRPHHAARKYRDFDDFLRSPWPTVGRERAPLQFASPVAMWNHKHAGYLQLRERRGAVVFRYEDLLRDPFEALQQLQRDHGLRASRTPFVNVEQSTRAGTPERDYAFLRQHFDQERWREELTAEQIGFIDENLDAFVMQRLDYARLT